MTKSSLDLRAKITSILVENDTALAPDADPPKKKKTKTKPKSQDLSMNLEDPASKGQVASPPKGGRSAAKVPGKISDKPVAPAQFTGDTGAQAAAHFSNMNTDMIGDDEISDEQALANSGRQPQGVAPTEGVPPEPPTPQNLPAVISRALTRTDSDYIPPDWQPEWKMVRQLPGYLQNAIRQLGRQVFRQFTDTPLEDIQVMATLAGDSDTDMDMMAHWIQQNGVRDDAMEMDFNDVIPGYTGQVVVYNTLGYTFVMVNDFAGKYIYAWPGGRGVHLEPGGNNLRIEGKISTRALVRHLIESKRA